MLSLKLTLHKNQNFVVLNKILYTYLFLLQTVILLIYNIT